MIEQYNIPLSADQAPLEISIHKETTNLYWGKGFPLYVCLIPSKDSSAQTFSTAFEIIDQLFKAAHQKDKGEVAPPRFFKLSFYGKAYFERTFVPSSWIECSQDYLIYKHSLCFLRAPPQRQAKKLKRTLRMIQKIPHTGVLQQTRNRYGLFTYVKVHDAFQFSTLKLLLEDEIARNALPPYYAQYNSIGAHISVIRDYEKRHNEIKAKIVNFSVGELKLIRKDNDLMILLEVECPKLSSVRKKIELSLLINDHPFHIFIGYVDHYFNPGEK